MTSYRPSSTPNLCTPLTAFRMISCSPTCLIWPALIMWLISWAAPALLPALYSASLTLLLRAASSLISASICTLLSSTMSFSSWISFLVLLRLLPTLSMQAPTPLDTIYKYCIFVLSNNRTYVTRRSKRWKQQQCLGPALCSYPSSQPSPRSCPRSASLPSPWRCSWEHWQWCCISILLGPCGSPCCQAGICTRRCGIMRWTPGSSQARETRSRALRRAWLPWTGSLNDYGDYEEYVDLLTLLLAAHHVLDKVYRDGFYSVGNKRLAIRKGATHRT